MVVLTLAVLFIIGIMFYAYGINRYNIDLKFSTIHAEMEAVNSLRKSEKNVSIKMIVFRVNNSGTKLCMAKPCDNCVKGIRRTLRKKNYRLKGNKCFYTNEDGEINFIKI
jgi:uncharacterized protein (UPF0333 family)|tara:strand:+ start:975 stop:1304 length:330 start_codon:yes stop_codon:yes gene_type:complete